MGRTIRTDSEILVSASDEPRFGEVWAYCNPDGMLVVHRFVRQQQGLFYFQGDAHWPDPPVPRDLLVGRVLRVRHRGSERRLGTRDRVTGGTRLVLLGRARALARRLGLHRVRALARSVLEERRAP